MDRARLASPGTASLSRHRAGGIPRRHKFSRNTDARCQGRGPRHRNRTADSDSVNLGSKPSPPANQETLILSAFLAFLEIALGGHFHVAHVAEISVFFQRLQNAPRGST